MADKNKTMMRYAVFVLVLIIAVSIVSAQSGVIYDCAWEDSEEDSPICKSLDRTPGKVGKVPIKCEEPEYSKCAVCINPEATEVCDGVDNNCDGKIDEDASGVPGMACLGGEVETVSCTDSYVSGFACDRQNAGTPLTVKFYKNSVSPGSFIGEATANNHNDRDADSSCGTTKGSNMFFWEIPESAKEGLTEVYAEVELNSKIVRLPGQTQAMVSDESCDNRDNDCNGKIDEGPAGVEYGICMAGWVDKADCTQSVVSGWACYKSTGDSIDLDIYKNGPAGQGTFIGRTAANLQFGGKDQQTLNGLCGNDGNYRFRFNIPSDKLAGTNDIYIHGINPVVTDGSANFLIPPGKKAIIKAAEVCNDGKDNNCDGESDYDGFTSGIISPAVHGDRQCAVGITGISLSPTGTYVENSDIKVSCPATAPGIRSIYAKISDRGCTFISWNGNTAEFSCKANADDTKVGCYIDTSKSYAISGQEWKEQAITVISSDCSQRTQGNCASDGKCTYCQSCSGNKYSGSASKCVAAGSCSYSCKSGQCGADYDADNGKQPVCKSDEITLAQYYDKDNDCKAEETAYSCSPYKCSSAACKTSCIADTDCAGDNVCSSGTCAAPSKGPGDLCAQDSECLSKSCAIYYKDGDNDMFGGSSSQPGRMCSPTGSNDGLEWNCRSYGSGQWVCNFKKDGIRYANNNLDCNDGNPNISPFAYEICDGIDNNCDSQLGYKEYSYSTGTENCNSGKDDDCDGSSGYDNSDGLFPDSDCGVQITDISVQADLNNIRENNNVEVWCTSSPGNVNSIYAYVDNDGIVNEDDDGSKSYYLKLPGGTSIDTLCTYNENAGWVGNTVKFTCNVGSVGSRQIGCGVDSWIGDPSQTIGGKSRQRGDDKMQPITVKSSSCSAYIYSLCPGSSCTPCQECSGKKSSGASAECLEKSQACKYECKLGSCGAECDATFGCEYWSKPKCDTSDTTGVTIIRYVDNDGDCMKEEKRVSCAPYKCSTGPDTGGTWSLGAKCWDSCTSGDNHCAADSYCRTSDGTCQSGRKPDGYACSSDADCQSNSCITVYNDIDFDTYGKPGTGSKICLASSSPSPSQKSRNNNDCDDANSAIKPGATEICGDNKDNNCDDQVDEGCAAQIDDVILSNGKMSPPDIGYLSTGSKYRVAWTEVDSQNYNYVTKAREYKGASADVLFSILNFGDMPVGNDINRAGPKLGKEIYSYSFKSPINSGEYVYYYDMISQKILTTSDPNIPKTIYNYQYGINNYKFDGKYGIVNSEILATECGGYSYNSNTLGTAAFDIESTAGSTGILPVWRKVCGRPAAIDNGNIAYIYKDGKQVWLWMADSTKKLITILPNAVGLGNTDIAISGNYVATIAADTDYKYKLFVYDTTGTTVKPDGSTGIEKVRFDLGGDSSNTISSNWGTNLKINMYGAKVVYNKGTNIYVFDINTKTEKLLSTECSTERPTNNCYAAYPSISNGVAAWRETYTQSSSMKYRLHVKSV